MSARVVTSLARPRKQRSCDLQISNEASSLPRKRLAVCSSGGQAVTEQGMLDSRQPGTWKQRVIYRDETGLAQRIKQLQLCVQKLQADRAADAEIFGEDFIRSSASEVLFALGEQPKSAGCSSWYEVLAQKKDHRLSNLVQSMNTVLPVPTTEDSMAVVLDSIIRRRNLTLLNRSAAELVSIVDDALQLFNRYPNLQQCFAPEYMVLQNFDKFRAAFDF